MKPKLKAKWMKSKRLMWAIPYSQYGKPADLKTWGAWQICNNKENAAVASKVNGMKPVRVRVSMKRV